MSERNVRVGRSFTTAALGASVTLAALVTLAACGDSSGDDATSTTAGDGGGSATTSGTGGGGTTEIACEGAPEQLSLVGTWAAYGKLAVSLTGAPGGAITICPADQIGESTMLLLLTMKGDPTYPKQLSEVRATLCSIALPTVSALVGTCDPTSDSLVTTQIVAPQTFLDALPKVATQPVTGTLDSATAGAALSLDRFVVTVGTTKGGEALPSWDTTSPSCNSSNVGRTKVCEMACVDDCAATRDDDSDGYPAVTVEICGFTPSDTQGGVPCNAQTPDVPGSTLQGKAFIDIEVNPQFTGVAKSSCEILGNVDTKVLYNLLGADVYLAGSPITVTQAIKSLPSFDVDPVASKFRMVRIDGLYGAPDWGVDPTQASAACAELLQHVNEL